MKRIAQQITDLIGNTPLVELRRFAPDSNIIAKLESFNPSSSVKDRLAKALVEDGERRGVLNIETTISGTGKRLKELKPSIEVIPRSIPCCISSSGISVPPRNTNGAQYAMFQSIVQTARKCGQDPIEALLAVAGLQGRE